MSVTLNSLRYGSPILRCNTPLGRTRVHGIQRSLVADDRFILATRDTGYRGLPAAVAELIDNAVQVGARRIGIFVREERQVQHAGDQRERQISIGVLDDGRGMDRDGLWTALQFGGTERFNDRSGLGRFGMGLPNSSVSVTRRVEVYSWRSPGAVISTYLDIDEVSQKLTHGIPEPKRTTLPPWAGITSDSGTLVIWPRCDRLEFKKASTVADKLRGPLGRMYRRLIWDGLRISVNGTPVVATDPLFCHPQTAEGGAEPFGTPLTYEITVPDTALTSIVSVRFTRLPVERWHDWSVERKRAAGIVGGAGVSFVRAGREIDNGWVLLGGKRKENYDDWWRCEVLFEPTLDECFGVTHSKQGVSPTAYVREIVEADMEAAARVLNTHVRSAFEGISRRAPSLAVRQATQQDCLLPPPRGVRRAVDGLNYRIGFAPIESRQFFEVATREAHVFVTINTDHPFYDRLYASALSDPTNRLREGLEFLVLGAARAYLGVSDTHEQSWVKRYWSAWGDALAAFTSRPRS